MIRDLYMTNLAIFNRHGMFLEQIAKSMDIAFLTLLDQLLEVGHFITALEMIGMTWTTNLYFQPLQPWAREKLLRSISLLGVRVQLKPGRINFVLLLCIPLKELWVLRWTLASKGYFCACIPYSQLTLDGMLCTCLRDIQRTLPRDG